MSTPQQNNQQLIAQRYQSVGVTCSVALIICILAFMWIARMLMKTPGLQASAVCVKQMQTIGQALDRYNTRNGKYPSSLDKLYPEFLTNRNTLHCPADRSPKSNITYQYTPPAGNAPDTQVVARCTKHTLLGKPAIVVLRKDGSVSFDNGQSSHK